MDYFNAFWVGGVICALVQILLDKTKLMPGRVMVILVCSGALLSAIGIYQPFADYAGAGASVPLLGFGQVLWERYEKSHRPGRFPRTFYRGIHSLCDWSFCCADFFLSRQPDLQTQNERLTCGLSEGDFYE